MEPKLSQPNFMPGQNGASNFEAPKSSESLKSLENAPVAEVYPQPAPPTAAPSLPSLPQPVPHQPLPQATGQTNSNPLLAGDEEVMEKEWVDRAKKIVSQTKDDPYTQEKEVSKLQADYLKKRYGKEVKLTDD